MMLAQQGRLIRRAYIEELYWHHSSIKLDFGFVANPSLPIHESVLDRFLRMDADEFFTHCPNRSFHNFCKTNHIPNSVVRVLGLGLKFCICDRPPPRDCSDIDLERFRKDVRTKYFFFCTSGDDDGDDDYEPKIYLPSPFWVPKTASTEIERAIDRFETTLKTLVLQHRSRNRPNLLRYELRLISSLRQNKNIIILPSDKNLGPVSMDIDEYVKIILTDHLLDKKRYTILSVEEAIMAREKTHSDMWDLINQHNEAGDFEKFEWDYFSRSYLRPTRNSKFYGLPKVHKQPLKLRPIVSSVNSEIEILSIFLDYQLQKVVRHCTGYLRDSWELLEEIKSLGALPSNARLITVDAVSMYDNIDTEHAIESIGKWLELHKADCKRCGMSPPEFILKGIGIVMRNNIFDFDNITCRQENGTAMGTSLACMFATIYFSYHEEICLCNKDRRDHGILLYRRFIDDVIVIQIQTQGSHAVLISDFNSFGPVGRRLEWLSSGPQEEVTFLDLNLRILRNGSIVVRTHEKPLNLHLYIPAHSAHSPSVP